LAENGIEVVAQLACEAAPNPHSFAYLRAKKEKMGHALKLLAVRRHAPDKAFAHAAITPAHAASPARHRRRSRGGDEAFA
jgi:hypothetical protein